MGCVVDAEAMPHPYFPEPVQKQQNDQEIGLVNCRLKMKNCQNELQLLLQAWKPQKGVYNSWGGLSSSFHSRSTQNWNMAVTMQFFCVFSKKCCNCSSSLLN
ncbi:hypothetical protein LguiA_012894 [Lonicera macranthoides]